MSSYDCRHFECRFQNLRPKFYHTIDVRNCCTAPEACLWAQPDFIRCTQHNRYMRNRVFLKLREKRTSGNTIGFLKIIDILGIEHFSNGVKKM